MRDGKPVVRASYDFEGFSRLRGAVMSSGEIILPPAALKIVFGRLGVQLLTDDGRLLDLRFSNKELRQGDDAALVEVSGDLPASPAEWRGGMAADPELAPPGPASGRSDKPISASARKRRASA